METLSTTAGPARKATAARDTRASTLIVAQKHGAAQGWLPPARGCWQAGPASQRERQGREEERWR